VRGFYSDHIELPAVPGLRYPASKQRALREAARLRLPGVRLLPGPLASEGELALAHDPAWIAAVVEGTLSAGARREIGLPWSPALAERSRCSVGATIAAARASLFDAEGVAVNLAGGSHHAHAHKGSGYCVFNDVAVAARLMQAEAHRRGRRTLLQVLVIDLDVHQGNGTASIFRHDDSVFTLSLHAAHNFPARKEAGDLDIALPDGCDDDTYLLALDAALAEAWGRLALRPPALAFYLAGADPHRDDQLGRLALGAEGLRERDRRVFAALAERHIPVVVAMAGGYGRELGTTVAIHFETLVLAFEQWQSWPRSSRRSAADGTIDR